MDQVKIGAFIAALRRERGWTQEDLGARLGVTNKTVSRWETGRYMPDIETLTLLGREFDVSLNELIQGQRLEAEDAFRAAADENLTSALGRPLTRFFRWLDRHALSAVTILILALLLGSVCVFHLDYRREHPTDTSLRGTFCTGPVLDQTYLTFQDFGPGGNTFVLHRYGEPLSLGTYDQHGETVVLTDKSGEETALLLKGNRIYAPTQDARFTAYEKHSNIPMYFGVDSEELGLWPPGAD